MKRIVAIAVAAVALLLFVTPASAHVSVNPKSLAAGSTVDLTFVVPNERDVDTTKVEVLFEGASVPTADTPSRPGWSSSVEIGTNGVTKVVWERGAIAPGQKETFVATIKVPVAGTELIAKTLQTYSSGEVVRWIDLPLPGGGEPEHPATVLAITGGAPTTSTTQQPTTTVTSQPAAQSNSEADSGLSTGKILMGIGVVLIVLVFVRFKIKRQQEL